MKPTIAKNISYICLLFLTITVTAQNQKGTFIDANIGLGITIPNEDVAVSANGFYAQVEYIWALKKWFSLRPYTGVITTSTDNDELSENLKDAELETKAWLLGGKFRLRVPIPYVAPFLELGMGASIGSFITKTPLINIDTSGVLLHIPITIGVGLGKNNKVNVAFAYYFTPKAEQVSGAAALGITIPLKPK